jgi:lipopolysaccharide transport system ATP-binding protein
MSDLAIRVQHVSKQYKIGRLGQQHDTLRDQLVEGLKSLVRRQGWRQARNNTIWALQDVSFEIKRGELVGIIGPNGAGKSTLLKILSRITDLTEGEAEIHGRVGSLLEVGTGFKMELTGRENLYLSGAILGMTKAEIAKKFDQIVAFAEIAEFLDTPVKHYSSGMYMRLAFAVAAHLDPEILLIDEVLAVGDLSFQRKCMEHAKRLQEGNNTVLIVSHNMFAIKAMCNRVIYIAGGRVCFDGAPEEAIHLYEQENRLRTLPGIPEEVGAKPSQRPISMTDMELFDENGQSRRVFNYGERMRIRLVFEAVRTVVNPNVVVAFIRSDNVACCNYTTSTDGVSIPALLGKGVIEVVTPPLKLVADSYSIYVLVWEGDFHRLYSSQIGTTFHVRHELFSARHFGVFHESADWVWHTTEAALSSASLARSTECL